MAKEYRIRIQNELTVDSQDVTGQAKQDPANTEQKSTRDHQQTAGAIAIYVGRQIASSVIGNFGTLTGNYIQQANVNSLLEVGTTLIMAAKFGKAGVIMAVANVASKAISYGANKNIENKNADMLNIRTGGTR